MAEIARKPSFFSSVASGVNGYIKGMFAGGAVGMIAGAVGGVVIGVFTGGIGAAALAGATYGGVMLASMGSLAGAVTGVVKSREAAQPTAADVVNVAKMSFAQGVSVGHNMELAAHHDVESRKFRDAEDKRRGMVTSPERQVVN